MSLYGVRGERGANGDIVVGMVVVHDGEDGGACESREPTF